jgi:hypothetical protein
MPRQIGAGAGGMKRLQRRSMHHQRDGDMVGSANAVKMVLDIAHNKADLIEVAQVIDHFQLRLPRCFSSGASARGGEQAGNSGRCALQHVAALHGFPHFDRKIMACG